MTDKSLIKSIYRLNTPISLEKYKDIFNNLSVNEFINPNIKDELMFKSFEFYKNNFYKNSKKRGYNLSDLQLPELKVKDINFWLTVGYDEVKMKEYIKEKYSPISRLMKNGLSESDAKAIHSDKKRKEYEIFRNSNSYNKTKYISNGEKYHKTKFGKSWLEEQNKREQNRIKKLKENQDFDAIKKSYGRTIENYSKKYGIEKATYIVNILQSKASKNRWKKYKDGLSDYLPNTILDFYIQKGMCLNDAYKALYERQATNTLEKYIKKYGEEIGYVKFKRRNLEWSIKMQKYLTENNFLKIKQLKGLKNYSKSSVDLFNEILGLFNCSNVYCGENEFFIYDEDKNKIFFYDLYLPDYNLIIEYHGIKFHPKFINEENWVHLYSKEGPKKYFLNDEYKKELALSKGFNYEVIWENKNNEKISLIKILEKYGINKK